ncbi:hypothetical protein BU14_0072s0037 [Porphyra umbilicalis]|uniref:Secreted protein n=1 Tax=Porphyra umbilicalis TaxID=2786 RepID=A0A1X6PFQ3_PORUM|nr:hypothetical protein BU14_0072s0037 [Porphyra umbilicalis]|eukprot:OSX79679.1 hypothetical protein BU14_0072s0037 [Porphyra umbilicalis]
MLLFFVSFPLRPSRLAMASVPFAALICLRSPPQPLDGVARTTIRVVPDAAPATDPWLYRQQSLAAAPLPRRGDRQLVAGPKPPPAPICRPDGGWASRFDSAHDRQRRGRCGG